MSDQVHVPVMPVGPVLLMNTMFNDILYELMVRNADPVAAI